MKKLILLISCALCIGTGSIAQNVTSGEILLGIKKLNVLGSVLYIAAHPDDENK